MRLWGWKWAILFLCATSFVQAENERIEEVKALVERDEELRWKWLHAKDEETKIELGEAIRFQEKEITQFLSQVFHEEGDSFWGAYPEDDWGDVLSLVIRSSDLDFQKKVLEDISLRNFDSEYTNCLTDRILLREKKPQRFATHFQWSQGAKPYKTEDIDWAACRQIDEDGFSWENERRLTIDILEAFSLGDYRRARSLLCLAFLKVHGNPENFFYAVVPENEVEHNPSLPILAFNDLMEACSFAYYLSSQMAWDLHSVDKIEGPFLTIPVPSEKLKFTQALAVLGNKEYDIWVFHKDSCIPFKEILPLKGVDEDSIEERFWLHAHYPKNIHEALFKIEKQTLFSVESMVVGGDIFFKKEGDLDENPPLHFADVRKKIFCHLFFDATLENESFEEAN